MNDQHLILNSTATTRPIYLLEAIIIGFVRMGLFHNVVRLSGDHNPARADAGIEDWANMLVVAQSGDELIYDLFLCGRKHHVPNCCWILETCR